MNALHVGKLTEETKFTVTEAMSQLIAEMAHKARCPESDIVRDCFWRGLTGMSYLDHVANDRRTAMDLPVLHVADKGGANGPA